MNNGAYFERLRDFLIEHAAIEFLEIHRDQALFDGAQTPVQLLVLRKGAADAGRYVLSGEATATVFGAPFFRSIRPRWKIPLRAGAPCSTWGMRR